MLLENLTLLLAASDILTDASWDLVYCRAPNPHGGSYEHTGIILHIYDLDTISKEKNT